jgi:hypothetical protein
MHISQRGLIGRERGKSRVTRLAETTIQSRASAPCAGIAFDAWLLRLLFAAVEPQQYEAMMWLLAGDWNEPSCTNDLAVMMHATVRQVGSVLSDLRHLGLVETTYRVDPHGRNAYHVTVEWVRRAHAWQLQLEHEEQG